MIINIEKIDWKRFQDLCADILKAEGFNIIRRSGVGSDRGMDIVVKKDMEYAPGCTKPFIWLVQCKHKSKKGSLAPNEVGEFLSDLARHNADGYWLMTNAYLSTSLEDKIVSINGSTSNNYKATYSNSKDLEDFVYKHRDLLKKYCNSGIKETKVKVDWRKTNPYKELQAYNENDHQFFFGRTKEIEELLNKIYKYKVVGLFGESGTGKTSLVNAGLIPNLKSEKFWIILVRCLDEPIKRIKEEAIKTLKRNDIPNEAIERIAISESFPHLIIELKILSEKENKNLIIIIDQFEELFTRAEEKERKLLSKGILESLVQTSTHGRVCFLLSLREDYIGELWDWSHNYNLEDAWIQTYRISRFKEEVAYDCIANPLKKLNIKISNKFIEIIISQLKKLGEGLIYPPYLQIVCSVLFEEFKKQNSVKDGSNMFDDKLYGGNASIETIIVEYLSESMLQGLTEEERIQAEDILDVLTGSEGLRAFLTLAEISRYIGLDEATTRHVVEHLTKKKIIHPVVEKDLVIGYELVHDFLSKKFFDKLGPEAKRAKTIIEIFRKAFKDWKEHKVLASKDRLMLLAENISQLNLNDEEWLFLVKSSFSVYWFDEGGNKIIDFIENERLVRMCKILLNDEKIEIVKESIRSLGKLNAKDFTLILKDMIESPKTNISIKECAVDQFWWNIVDVRILETLRNLIRSEKNFKIRKSAVYAFGKNISKLFRDDYEKIDLEIEILFEALNDGRAPVRKQVADVLCYYLVREKCINPLIKSFDTEKSVLTKKSIVLALGALLRKGEGVKTITRKLKEIVDDKKEDYRIKEEARNSLEILRNQRSYFVEEEQMRRMKQFAYKEIVNKQTKESIVKKIIDQFFVSDEAAEQIIDEALQEFGTDPYQKL